MAGKRTAKKSEKQKIVQEALQVTWVLKGQLKNAQLAYLRIGAMLIKVRDGKLFAALGHPDMEDYAEERLRMKRSSLYKYLQVYEWVAEFHKEWLQPKPKGFIPELNDVADLMWIERKLGEKGLSRQVRSELDAMRKAALEGGLRDSDLDNWRKRGGRRDDALKAFLGKVRLLRRRAVEMKNMPADAVGHLDGAIESISNALSTERNLT